ncbi:hypothetical protein ACU686_02680 [Yinghuangia aomiensis]
MLDGTRRAPRTRATCAGLGSLGVGGAPPTERIARIADDYRYPGAAATSPRPPGGRRARAALPLGVCFLPAFLLIGVVPVAIGLAGPLLSGT